MALARSSLPGDSPRLLCSGGVRMPVGPASRCWARARSGQPGLYRDVLPDQPRRPRRPALNERAQVAAAFCPEHAGFVRMPVVPGTRCSGRSCPGVCPRAVAASGRGTTLYRDVLPGHGRPRRAFVAAATAMPCGCPCLTRPNPNPRLWSGRPLPRGGLTCLPNGNRLDITSISTRSQGPQAQADATGPDRDGPLDQHP